MMRTITFALLSVILISSCVTPAYYQVYQLAGDEQIKSQSNYFYFENEHCRIVYDFWGSGGSNQIKIYNLSDQDICIVNEDSYFIKNDLATPFYQRRVYTQSSSSGLAVTNQELEGASETGINAAGRIATASMVGSRGKAAVATRSQSVSTEESRLTCIPPRSERNITSYALSGSTFRSCDFPRFPSHKNLPTKNYDSGSSPLSFRNHIVYSTGRDGATRTFENRFWVKSITNMPESKFQYADYEEVCGRKTATRKSYLSHYSPQKFYIKYFKMPGLAAY